MLAHLPGQELTRVTAEEIRTLIFTASWIIPMAKRMRVPPTRSNLLRLREQLKQARAGHALLEHKREVLTHELLVMIEDAEATDAEATQRFGPPTTALFEVRMRMGGDRLHWASLAHAAEIHTEVELHSIMGVAVPLVQMDVTPLPCPTAWATRARHWTRRARAGWTWPNCSVTWPKPSTTVWRLATELQKTQRRVNALEDVLIPQFEATLQLHQRGVGRTGARGLRQCQSASKARATRHGPEEETEG